RFIGSSQRNRDGSGLVNVAIVQATTASQIRVFFTVDWTAVLWVIRTDGLGYAAPPVNAGECPRRSTKRVRYFYGSDIKRGIAALKIHRCIKINRATQRDGLTSTLEQHWRCSPLFHPYRWEQRNNYLFGNNGEQLEQHIFMPSSHRLFSLRRYTR